MLMYLSLVQYRAIYIEYEPRHKDENIARPFHHARIVVTDSGQHLDGEPLTARSTGYIFDRYGSKEYTKEGEKIKELGIVEEGEPYEGCEPGFWSIYWGYTRFSFKEIKQIGKISELHIHTL
jgi:hypothetical protein